jgi:hypothetical protein
LADGKRQVVCGRVPSFERYMVARLQITTEVFGCANYYSDRYTSCYFQSLYRFVLKHPAHILLPFVNLHGQEAFEQQMDRLTWRQ